MNYWANSNKDLSIRPKKLKKIDENRYSKNMIFKDVLKKGEGTEFIIDDVQFDVEIPESRFSKAALRK